MGFFLIPESSELIIGSKNLGTLECFSSVDNEIISTKENKTFVDFEIDYLVDLTFDNDYFECHNLGFNNVAELIVLSDNEDISNKCTVTFTFNKNGLRGLGTELIRLAHNYNRQISVTIEPIKNDNAKNSFGFFLTPKSSLLKIGCKNFNNVFFYDQEFGNR